MNVRLYSGDVRCPDCFDASSYASNTTDPCGYCGAGGDVETVPFRPNVNHDSEAEGFITRTLSAYDAPTVSGVEPQMTGGTFALFNTVAEDERSLMRHVAAFRKSDGKPTTHTAFGSADCHPECHRHYRWTWEHVYPDGGRSIETVWATRV